MENPVTLHGDHLDFLKNSFSERCQKNPRYSLRAFARDLGISPPRLSHILNGKKGLSLESALKIAKSLSLTDEETKFFCTSVEAKHSRSKLVREKAEQKFKEIQSQYKDLNVEHFKIISDWYHFAIMELTLVEDFKSDSKWIAKTLNISELQVKDAIERLLKMDMIEIDMNSNLRITGNFFADPKGVPSQGLRHFHKQLLEKATQSLEFQTLDQRDVSSIVVAIDENDIPWVKQEIKNFRTRLDKKLSSARKKTKVYNLGIQFFGLQI